MRVDPAATLLRLVVRALPERQAEWGEAMRAELAGITGPRERWRFAAGCAYAVICRPAGARAVARWLAATALLVVAVVLAWAIGVPRVRGEALGVVACLVLGLGLLRSRFGFGPVATTRGAGMVAAGGTLAVAAEVMLGFRRLRVDPPLTLPMNATVGVYDSARATMQLIVLVVVVGVLLVAVGRVTAARSDVRPSTIAIGAGTAVLTATAWLAVVLLHPTASTVPGPASLGVLAAGLVAAVGAGHLAAPAREPGVRVDARQGLVAGLLAAAGTTTGIGVLMDLLPLTGHWVANDAPPVFAADPPTRIIDTVVVWLPGLVFTVALMLAVRRQPQMTARAQMDQPASRLSEQVGW